MSEELVKVARRQVEAFNEADWDALRDTLAPDSVYEEPATGRRVEGADAVVEANRGWKEAFPDASGAIKSTLASGDRIAAEITWSGTHGGTLGLPGGGSVPPTGKPFEVEACEVMRIEDGRVVEARNFFDLLGLLEQLGTISAEALEGAAH